MDPVRQVLKLCDFGSAKAFVKGEPNVAYICSRFYRAPELIFGSTDYNTMIDVWSQGCVFAELLIGSPIFPGSSGVDQLVEIIKVQYCICFPHHIASVFSLCVLKYHRFWARPRRTS